MTVIVDPSTTKTDLCCKKSLILSARLSKSLRSPAGGLKVVLSLVEELEDS